VIAGFKDVADAVVRTVLEYIARTLAPLFAIEVLAAPLPDSHTGIFKSSSQTLSFTLGND